MSFIGLALVAKVLYLCPPPTSAHPVSLTHSVPHHNKHPLTLSFPRGM